MMLLALVFAAQAESPEEEAEELRERIRALEQQLDALQANSAITAEAVELPLDLDTRLLGYSSAVVGVTEDIPLSAQLSELLISYWANLDRWATFQADVVFQPSSLEGITVGMTRAVARMDTGLVGVDVGLMPNTISHWNTVAPFGAYLFLPVEAPEMIDPGEGFINPYLLGLGASAAVPVGFWQVHLGAQASNGRSPSLLASPLSGDLLAGKAALLRVVVESPGGLQVGGAASTERLVPYDEFSELLAGVDTGHSHGHDTGEEEAAEDTAALGLSGYGREHALSGRIIFDGGRLQVWGEAIFTGQGLEGEALAWTWGGYGLVGYHMERFSPFAMVERRELSSDSPVHAVFAANGVDVGIEERYSVGLRHELLMRAAVKVQGGIARHAAHDDHAHDEHGAFSSSGFAPSAQAQLAVGF